MQKAKIMIYFCYISKRKNDNMKEIKINKRAVNVLLGVIAPLLIIFLGEAIHRQSISKTFGWVTENIGIVLINYTIIYFVFYLMQVIFNKTKISFIITSMLYFIITTISYLKYSIRGEVLLINDFALVNQAEGLISFVEPQMILKTPIIIALIFTVVFAILLHCLKIKTKRKNNLSIFVGISLISYFLFINQYTSNNLLKLFRNRYRS